VGGFSNKRPMAVSRGKKMSMDFTPKIKLINLLIVSIHT